MKTSIPLILALCIYTLSAHAQGTNAPLNPDYYHLLDRFEIKSGSFSKNYYTTMKPYRRDAIAAYMDSIRNAGMDLSKQDRFNLEYLENDNWEWSKAETADSKKPLFNALYRKKPDFYHVDTEDFDLHINPVLYFSLGREVESDARPYINTRGVELRGMINRRLGFYTFIGENQAMFPGYVRGRIAEKGVVPGEGYWKDFGEGGTDFFTARGYISFDPIKSINIQFGHDKFKVGNGYRSMLLSDFGHNYLFLKVNTQVWKINYTNLFTEMQADAFGIAGTRRDRFPKKYMAFHHLGINFSKNFNLGIFEAIMYGQADSLGSGFDMAYLNPIIFYRAIEQQDGSSGNALLGADFKWNFARHFSLYGQWILDEFKLDEVKSGEGWWANKFAGQLGLKYIDVLGISNLDLQLEGNFARPYTYSHDGIYTNFAHYRQPLAHPLGANFKEYLAIVRYQPLKRLRLTGKAVMMQTGLDVEDSNWGADILLDYRTREQEYGNETGQGVATDIMYVDFTASFMLKHNLFIDLKQVYRKLDSEIISRSNTTHFTSLALRLNIAAREHVF